MPLTFFNSLSSTSIDTSGDVYSCSYRFVDRRMFNIESIVAV